MVCHGDSCNSNERTHTKRHYRCKACYWIDQNGVKMGLCSINPANFNAKEPLPTAKREDEMAGRCLISVSGKLYGLAIKDE
jgi:hypothetical protein